jgi:hypothetical protein
MRYLKWGSTAALAAFLVLWYEARSVVDEQSAVGIFAALLCMVALLVSHRLPQTVSRNGSRGSQSGRHEICAQHQNQPIGSVAATS